MYTGYRIAHADIYSRKSVQRHSRLQALREKAQGGASSHTTPPNFLFFLSFFLSHTHFAYDMQPESESEPSRTLASASPSISAHIFCMQHVSSFLNVSSSSVCLCVCVCVYGRNCAWAWHLAATTAAHLPAPHFSLFADCVPYADSYVNESKTWKQESEDRKCSYRMP